MTMLTKHELLPGWLDSVSSVQADPGNLKRLLAERGFNGRDRRLCLDLGDALFYPLEADF